MSKADQFVTKLEGINTELEKLGDEFVQHFPRSSSLYRFVDELGLAQQGLQALLEELSKAVQTAESENKIKQDLMAQINESEIYNFLDNDSKERLAEYLVQQGAPLATAEDLLTFAVRAIQGLDAENIVKNLSKEFVMQLGGAPIEGGEQTFDAYRAGVEHIKQILGDPEEKDQFVGTLAREYLKRQPELTVRRFYNKVAL